MKHILKIFILLIGFVLYFNANSFANIDIGNYGGYVISGDDGYDDFTGTQFGTKAHYNIQLSSSIDLGLGAFFQYSSYEFDDGYGKLLRGALGVDVNLIFSTSAESDFYPYVRGTYSFSDTLWSNFSGWGIGGGIEYAISPNLSLFTEFMYEKGNNEYWWGDIDVTAMAINVGVKNLILM